MMRTSSDRLRHAVLLAVLAAGAMVLSYVEALLPPLYAAIPGIKLGLPNVVITFALYRLGARDAACISLLRLLGVAFLFGNAVTLLYSLAGALLSWAVMLLCMRCGVFSAVGVGIAGGVSHNVGQILVAVWLLRTPQIAYYLIVLTFTGTLAGAFVGCLAGLCVRYTKRVPIERYLGRNK